MYKWKIQISSRENNSYNISCLGSAVTLNDTLRFMYVLTLGGQYVSCYLGAGIFSNLENKKNIILIKYPFILTMVNFKYL